MQIIQTLSDGMILSRSTYLPLSAIQSGSYWTASGTIARVRKSHSTDRLYAEEFNIESMRFSYAKGLVYHLDKRMTLDEAKAWGARLGHCCVCGAKLTDNRSVEAGIGPVCVKKL